MDDDKAYPGSSTEHWSGLETDLRESETEAFWDEEEEDDDDE